MAKRSSRRRELVEGEIIETAAHLFAMKGMASTSLQEIADAMEISRPALYYYIHSKEELLSKLVKGVTLSIADDVSEIAALQLGAPERLQRAITRIASLMIEQPARFRLLERAHDQLTGELASQERQGRARVRDALTQIIHDGVAEGTFVACEPRIAAFAILGMTNWIAWWVHSETTVSSEQIIETMTTVAMGGLVAADRGRAGSSPAAVSRSLASIRAELALLEQSL